MTDSIEKGLIRWRVVRELKGRGVAQLVGYIDGRTCMELLDKEDPSWSVQHTPFFGPDGELRAVQADLTVDGVTRSDVGIPSNQDKIKGAYSDALKRAAVHFGIGRELYELPQVYAGFDPETKTPTQKPTFDMDTGKWKIDAPGWVWYPEEEADPSAPKKSALDEQLDLTRTLLAARPDLRGAVSGYVKDNNLNKEDVEDMTKLNAWLEVEAAREVK